MRTGCGRAIGHPSVGDRQEPHRRCVTVEHSLASIAASAGPPARYKGTRKNFLDLRRRAAVANRQVLRAGGVSVYPVRLSRSALPGV
jgi:hypothetical protein